MTVEVLEVAPGVHVPRTELKFRASRSGGPGGQHVNKSATRVEVAWNIADSRAVTDEQRERLRTKLGGRLDGSGTLRVVASGSRSQARNRSDAEQRLVELVRSALLVPKARRRTRPARSVVEARLRTKKRLSEKKRERGRRPRQDFD